MLQGNRGLGEAPIRERACMLKNTGWLPALLCAIAATWPSPAPAQTNLGAPNISGDCGMPASGGSVACGGITESAYYAGGEGYLSFSWNDESYGLGTASPRIESEFEVLGPDNTNATLVLTANATTSIAESFYGSGSIDAEVAVSNFASYAFQADACSSVVYECMLADQTGLPSSLSISHTFTVSTNTPYLLVLDMYAYQVNQGQLSASIDPNITFAPGFQSSGDTLIYSANATPPVPEPAALLLFGVGLMGFFISTIRNNWKASRSDWT